MQGQFTRREMLKTSAAIGAGLWLGGSATSRAAAAPNERLNLAFIGVGGRGRDNLNELAKLRQNVVALCDVDETRAGNAFEKFPQARKFSDFRRMLDELESEIDGVVISTPDHTHFHPAWQAMHMGKHIYCEKPMAHSLVEVRWMTQMAAEKKLATQLGVQRHALDNVHRVVELIQYGAIGDVQEVHCWIGGDRGMPDVPQDTPPVPATLDWDLWIGPAKMRPYHPSICPYGWRFWWDYGTGEMGNWGCHILDIPFWALGLTQPTRVAADGPDADAERTPKQMATRFEFPPSGDRPAITLHWSHAKNGPPILKEHGLSDKGANTLFIGTEGMLLCGFGMRKLYPEEKFQDFRPPEPTLPDSPGFWREWVDACRGGPAATCHFDYSGPLSETVLLGNVAYRAGGFEWDAAALRAKGNTAAQALVSPAYREGWELAKT